ncbi:MAG TPA: glycosyltransferase [Pirellulales bacterium]|jgi:hypothetical protein|nr:glycosyltransferase [Pirellulales bacterium]
MRIAIVSAAPDDMLVDKPGWVAEGFAAAGHDVLRVHDLGGVRSADAHCDALLFDQHAAGCNVGSLAELAAVKRAVWVQWWRDLVCYDRTKPLAEQDHIRTFGRFLRRLDLVLVKERSAAGPLASYAELDIKAVYLDQACPADMPACEHAERPEFDVLVLGTTAYRQRRDDARALAAAGYRVLWAGLAGPDMLPDGVTGHGWVHPLRELPALASRCGVLLGVDYATDAPGYTSDRSYLAGGMGACYIARVDVAAYGAEWSHAELAKVAPALHAASWCYESTDGLLECVRQALASRDERQRRGRAARERILREHTYRQRAEAIVEALKASGGR